MYFNLRLSTLQFFSRSICKLTKSSTFSLTFFFALGSFVGFGQTFRSQQSAVAANNSVTIAKPSGLAIGDLMIAQISRSSDNNVNLTNASSSGWSVVTGNQYRSNSNDRWHVTVLSKFATSADVAATGFTFTGTNADNSMGAISAYSGACRISVIGAWGETTDDDTYSAPGITTPTANSIVIMFGAVANKGRLATDNTWSFNGVSMAERYDIAYNATSDMGIACATLERNSVSTGAGSATISNNERNTSLLLAISGNPSVTASASNSSICMGNNVNLSSDATSNSNATTTLLNQNFNSTPTGWTTSNTSTGGTTGNAAWSLRANGYSYTYGSDPAVVFNSNDNSQFYLTNSASQGNGANTKTRLQSPSFSTVGLSAASLSFYHYFRTYSGTSAIVEISTNGTSWTTLATFTSDRGNVSSFIQETINLNSFLGQATVSIRFRYNGGWGWYWALDNVSVTGTLSTPPAASFAWVSSTGGFTSSIQNPTGVSPSATTTYTVTATNNYGCTASANTTVNLPTAGTALSANNDNASCVVNQFGWVHFYHSSGRLIGSINSQGQNLGNVTMSSYVETSNTAVPSCASPTDPTLMTSVLRRHWLVNPQFQPSTPVLVRWPHAQTEFAALSSASTTNANLNDDAQSAADLKLSKYNGPNENANPLDNCGPGTTTLISQVANSGGPVSAYAPNIQGAVFYTEFAIPSFSEFWLHGSSNSSPLPVELTSFNAICEEGKGVNVTWTTASEHNSSYFDVLKSEDGHNWRSISTVSAAGNSTNIINYGIVDAEKANGVAYYKLMQYDIDGESKEYGPISSDCYHLGEMRVKTFPNPSGDEFYVELISPEATSTVITLVDAQGKSVYTRTVETEKGTNLYTFEALNVLPGMYYIQISNDITTPSVVKHSFR